MSPQNVANVANAFARLECYEHDLFYGIRERLLQEDLGKYKLYELANLTHSLAKLNCGGKLLYTTLFGEFLARLGLEPGQGGAVGVGTRQQSEWEPRSVVQVLDAMRRKQAFIDEGLLLELMCLMLKAMQDYEVQQLTQGAWCLVELDALDLAWRVPLAFLPPLTRYDAGGIGQGAEESPGRRVMRGVLERMEELNSSSAFTPTVLCYVQNLVRAYHYKNETDYNLQPQHVKAFCKSLFAVPTAVTSSVTRRRR